MGTLTSKVSRYNRCDDSQAVTYANCGSPDDMKIVHSLRRDLKETKEYEKCEY